LVVWSVLLLAGDWEQLKGGEKDEKMVDVMVGMLVELWDEIRVEL
jgi:hypothetical protein